MTHCSLCKVRPGETDSLCQRCRSLHRLCQEVLRLPEALYTWSLEQSRLWCSIVQEEHFKCTGAQPHRGPPEVTAKAKAAAARIAAPPPRTGRPTSVKREPEDDESTPTGLASPVRASSSGIRRERRSRSDEDRKRRRSRSRRSHHEERHRHRREEREEARHREESSRSPRRRTRDGARDRRKEDERPSEPAHPPPHWDGTTPARGRGRHPAKGRGKKGLQPRLGTNKGVKKRERQRDWRERER